MLGFAAVDRRSDALAVWLISRTDPTEASSTNAVVVDLADENARRKVHSLTCDRIVVATPGSDLAGLRRASGLAAGGVHRRHPRPSAGDRVRGAVLRGLPQRPETG